MSYKNTQSRPGYPHQESSNPTKPATHRPEPDRDPLIAQSKRDALGNHMTTNYPMKDSKPPDHSGGAKIEGQHLRGFVHNDKGRGTPRIQDGNRMGLDMSERVKKISGPDMPSGPALPNNTVRGGGQSGD